MHVHTRYRERGGEETVVELERRLLAEAGDDVVAVDLENPAGAGAAPLLAAAPWNRAAAARVAAAAEGADVAHVHNTWFALSAAVVPALHRVGVPVVATLHNYRLGCPNGLLWRDGARCTDCVGRLPLPGVLHRCARGSALVSAVAGASGLIGRSRFGLGGAELLVCPSTGIRHWAVAAGLPEARLRVVPHASADPGPRPGPPATSDVVLFVGRVDEGKGVDVLLDAWRRLGRAHPGHGLRLEVVGDGALRAGLEASGPAGVRFLGVLGAADVRARLLSARALAFPSVWLEPYGLVVPEALAAGLPVVASDVGTGADVGDAGRVVPPGDAGALAEALADLLDDDRVARMAGAARARWAGLAAPARWQAEMRLVHREAAARGAP